MLDGFWLLASGWAWMASGQAAKSPHLAWSAGWLIARLASWILARLAREYVLLGFTFSG